MKSIKIIKFIHRGEVFVLPQDFKLLSPKIDVIFQKLFGEVGSEEITKDFLNAILEEDIASVDLSQNIVLRRDDIQDKLGILDVLVHFNNSEVCNIEMQMISQTNIIQRLLYYWSKTYIKNIKKSQDYSNLKRTICILIANFTLDSLKELDFLSKWKLIDLNGRKKVLTDLIEIDIIELPKIHSFDKNKQSKILNWLYFLENPSSKVVDNIMKENKAIKQAKDKLQEMSYDDKMQRLQELREAAIYEENTAKSTSFRAGLEQGLVKGKAEGKIDGKREKQIEIAKKMKKEGLEIELISKMTELSIEEIKIL